MIADGGGSNLYPPELEGTFTPDEVRERIYGSKIVLVSEQAMLNVIYTLKACMLIMYSRLTAGLRDERNVRLVTAYVVAGWLATQVAFFTACRPFRGYWAVPPPDPQCTTLEHYAIVQGCFNISSDLLMLFIPMPLVARARLPWRQKVALALVFSLGLFVVTAALLTKVFNLTDVYSPEYMLWYVREAGVAVCVTNLPMIWPVLRDWFPALRYVPHGTSAHKGQGRSGAAGGGRSGRTGHSVAGRGGTGTEPGLDLERFETHSTTKLNKMTSVSDETSSAVLSAADAGRSPTRDSWGVGVRRATNSIARVEDLEMAMAANGGDLGGDKEFGDRSVAEDPFDTESQHSSEAYLGRVQSPQRFVLPERTTDPWSVSGEPGRKLTKTDKEYKKKPTLGMIQVQTTVDVTEERAQGSRAAKGHGWEIA